MLLRIEKILLILIILFLPSQTSLHIWPEWSFVTGVRVDYLSPTLYLTDILLVLLLFIWIRKSRPRLPEIIKPAAILVLLNIIFSFSPYVSIYRFLRLGLYFGFFLYLISNRIRKEILIPLSLACLWTSILAVSQFISQSSLGGFIALLGERPLSLTSPQIAKIPFGNMGLFLRPYSTLPHPNALAGFLIVSVLLIESLVNEKTNATWQKHLVRLCQLTGVTALVLTFSRTGLAAFSVVVFIYYFGVRIRTVSRLIISGAVLLLVAVTLPGDSTSLTQRYIQIKQTIIYSSQRPLLGTGYGAFIPYSDGITNQPLHNVFILSTMELGISALILYYLIYRWHKSNQLPPLLFLGALAVFITANMDHYWYTIPQNMVLLTILIARLNISVKHG